MTAAGYGTTAVILNESRSPPVALVRDALVEALGMHRIDATQQARRCGACDLLVEDVDPGPARRLVESLARRGIRALALRGELIPPLGRPQMIRRMACRPGSLALVHAAGEAHEHIVWDAILLFAAGVIQQPKETEYELKGGEPTFRGARTQKRLSVKRTQPEPKTELWLVLRSGLQVRRFVEDGLNYDYLGPRRQHSATMNFRAFLADLLKYAPHARVSDSVLSFLRKDKPGTHRFRDADAFNRYCRAQAIIALRERGELEEG